jgi:hypothetical protein
MAAARGLARCMYSCCADRLCAWFADSAYGMERRSGSNTLVQFVDCSALTPLDRPISLIQQLV